MKGQPQEILGLTDDTLQIRYRKFGDPNAPIRTAHPENMHRTPGPTREAAAREAAAAETQAATRARQAAAAAEAGPTPATDLVTSSGEIKNLANKQLVKQSDALKALSPDDVAAMDAGPRAVTKMAQKNTATEMAVRRAAGDFEAVTIGTESLDLVALEQEIAGNIGLARAKEIHTATHNWTMRNPNKATNAYARMLKANQKVASDYGLAI